MRELPLRWGPVRFEGAIELRLSPLGITPLRLPESTFASLPPFLSAVASCSAGVRLTLTTNSQTLAVEVDQVSLAPTHGAFAPPAMYELVIDNEVRESVTQSSGVHEGLTETIGGTRAPTVLRFAGLGTQQKRLELWLPVLSSVTVRRVLVEDDADAEPTLDARPRWIVHGSSITHGARAHSPSQTWPAHAARLANLNLVNLGMGGNCLVDQWVARAIRDTVADMITLKLAVNVWNFAAMNERAFVGAVHGFLDTIRDGHPDTAITVISPIHTPGGETVPGPSTLTPQGHHVGTGTSDTLSIGHMRDTLSEIVSVRRSRGDLRLSYLDGQVLLGPGDVARLVDSLHPDGAGHVLMGERHHEFTRSE